MGVIDSVRNFFRKGGVSLGLITTLQQVTDHPKINVDPQEYLRIKDSVDMYKGDYGKINYLNSYGMKKTRELMSLNMIKQVSETMASLVFNEQCVITVGSDGNNKEASEFIAKVFEHNDFKKNFARYLEPMFATGGLAVRPYIDTSTGQVEFSWAQANTFYPLRSNTNNISEAAIATVSTRTEGKNTAYYTLIEFHEWSDGHYVISNELYRSEINGVTGTKVPLSTIYEGLAETATLSGLSRPIYAYVKPNGFNNISPYSPLGLGVCDNCKPTLKQINTTYDQMNWEIQMGQRKVIVSDHFLQSVDDELGNRPQQVFDEDSNIFVGLKGDMDTMIQKDITHDLRVEKYVLALNQQFKTLEMQTKLSAGTFSFDGQSVKTATEVVSENSATYRTRNAQIVEVTKFIKELIISVCELSKATIGTNGESVYKGEIPTFDDIGIDFDDGVFTDKNDQLEYYAKASASGFIPKAEVLQRIWDIPENEAQEWLQKITNEELIRNPEVQQTNAEVSLLGREE